MNNEEKILSLLERMDQRMLKLETDTAAVKAKMALFQMDMADVKTGQEKLRIGQEQLQGDVTEIKASVKYIWEDLGRLGDRLNEHDVIIQKRVM